MKLSVTDPADQAFRRHRAQVHRYLRRRVASDELAEDLTQEVFIAAAAHLARLDSDGPVLAWLYKVARNRLLDELRRARRRPQLLSLDVVPEPTELDFGPDLAKALRRASLNLSAADRELVGLRLFGECTFADVAAQFGISEPAAKMRYVRALRALRLALEQEGISP